MISFRSTGSTETRQVEARDKRQMTRSERSKAVTLRLYVFAK